MSKGNIKPFWNDIAFLFEFTTDGRHYGGGVNL